MRKLLNDVDAEVMRLRQELIDIHASVKLAADNAERDRLVIERLREALKRIAACDDGENPHTIEDDDHDPFMIARAAIDAAQPVEWHDDKDDRAHRFVTTGPGDLDGRSRTLTPGS